ncbi:MAG: hypothetical protein K9J27_10490 [Bacteroidales bacterium]|nr:hypothetical protein [Bacteroidales bacterium]MCF8334250.1 hypothetical protein [Bacteroidales bacterium]
MKTLKHLGIVLGAAFIIAIMILLVAKGVEGVQQSSNLSRILTEVALVTGVVFFIYTHLYFLLRVVFHFSHKKKDLQNKDSGTDRMNPVFIPIFTVTGIVGIFFLVLILRPVPVVTEKEALTEKGVVENISEGGENDIVFYLKNTDQKFFINRGLEKGLEINNLKEKLVGKKVRIKYPKHWTPLDWNNSVKHLSKVEYSDQVIFNELIAEKR